MVFRSTVTIFAASRLPKDTQVVSLAEELGEALGKAGFNINYGAGTNGLMGKVAFAARAAGAQINAFVLPLYKEEAQVPGACLITVETEQERFFRMSNYQQPIAMIVLPGGPGALRESLQALEIAVYGQGPSVILVKAGPYLDGIKNYFDLAVEQGMIRREHKDKLKLLTLKETISFLTQPAAFLTSAPMPKMD